jgi:hypothetical protein
MLAILIAQAKEDRQVAGLVSHLVDFAKLVNMKLILACF